MVLRRFAFAIIVELFARQLNSALAHVPENTTLRFAREKIMPIDLPKLRRLIEDIPQSDIAKRADITQAMVSLILAGKYPRPSLDVVDRLAMALGVTARDIVK